MFADAVVEGLRKTNTGGLMFRDAKVGDAVWSVVYGWGKVVSIDLMPDFPVLVKFDSQLNSGFSYRRDGRYAADQFPTLFWDEVPIVAPPRPKRKVKKVLEGWVNLFRGCKPGEAMSDELLCQCTHLFRNRADLENHKRDFPRNNSGWRGGWIGEPIFIRQEFEVEE